MVKSTLSPIQCRMARAGCRITQSELATEAKVSVATLADFEAGKRMPYDRTLRDIRKALDAKGVEFLEFANGKSGVSVDG